MILLGMYILPVIEHQTSNTLREDCIVYIRTKISVLLFYYTLSPSVDMYGLSHVNVPVQNLYQEKKQCQYTPLMFWLAIAL